MKTPKLKEREWIAVLFLMTAFVGLSLKALQTDFSRWPVLNSEPVEKPAVLVVIQVKGEVARPGRYHFREGTALKEVIAQASPLPQADLARLDLTKKVRKGMRVHVPKQKVAKRKR